MKRIMMIGLAVVGIGLAAAYAGGLECAIDTAIEGKTTTIEWIGHKYQIRPVEMTEKDKRTHTLTGSIYVNGKKTDDTVAYRITKNRGAVQTIEIQMNDGMWLPLSPQMNTALGDYRKTSNVDDEKQTAIKRALYKAGEGSWKNTAELIVALIAIKHC
jgi:hypothetical protein